MNQVYIEDQRFIKINFSEQRLEKGDYEYCTFKNCDFFNGDLSDVLFMDCEFIDCNMSSVNLKNTSFQNINFRDCKLMGLHFDACNQFCFSVSFEGCQLMHSTFYQVKLDKTKFINSKLQKVDFTESSLKESLFDKCDLSSATFERSILEKADFQTSTNYSIIPENNRIKGAKFSVPGVFGLLDNYDIKIIH